MAWTIALILFGNWLVGMFSGAQLGLWIHGFLLGAVLSLFVGALNLARQARFQKKISSVRSDDTRDRHPSAKSRSI